MTRRIAFDAMFIAGLFILGGLCGWAARAWIGGIGAQRAQLERCVLRSKQSRPGEDARSSLARIDAEVPACMSTAGYEKALDNPNCATEYWQGDVFCYLPSSYLGKLIYRLETASGRNKIAANRDTESRTGEGA